MTRNRDRRLRVALLALGLLAGLFAMHVLGPPPPSSAPAVMSMEMGDQPASHPGEPQPQPESGHVMWQLCLAVLTGLTLIVVALVALTLRGAAARSGLVSWRRLPSLLSRRPRPARFTLCVLRT